MNLQENIHRVFKQLSESMEHLDDGSYTYPCVHLSGSTIGKHVRHIIEMYQCLEKGYQTGEVDYENRKRDIQIETDIKLAVAILPEILRQIRKVDRSLVLLTYYDSLATGPERIQTNYFREIAYNLEHTIHHMALIRVGLREIGGIPVDDSYGVADSTLKYRKQCAQ